MKKCAKCDTPKRLEEFYPPYGKKKKVHSYCIECQQNKNRERVRDLKRLCVLYKGSKCVLCGYHRCIEALEFHHRNPNEKDFQVSKVRYKSFDENIKNELDKCDLVCANCHREIHYG